METPEEATPPTYEETYPSDIPSGGETVPLQQKQEPVASETFDNSNQVPAQSTFEYEGVDVPKETPPPFFEQNLEKEEDEEERLLEDQETPDDGGIYPTTTTHLDVEKPTTHFEESTQFLDTTLLNLDPSTVEESTTEPVSTSPTPTPDIGDDPHTTDPIPTPENVEQQTEDHIPIPEMEQPVVGDNTFSVGQDAGDPSQMQGNLAQHQDEDLKSENSMPKSSPPLSHQPPNNFETETNMYQTTTTQDVPTETPPPVVPPVKDEQLKKGDGGPGWRSFDDYEEEEEDWGFDDDDFEDEDWRDDEDWPADDDKVDESTLASQQPNTASDVPTQQPVGDGSVPLKQEEGSDEKVDSVPDLQIPDDSLDDDYLEKKWHMEKEFVENLPQETEDQPPKEDISTQTETTKPHDGEQDLHHKQEENLVEPEEQAGVVTEPEPAYTPPVVPTPSSAPSTDGDDNFATPPPSPTHSGSGSMPPLHGMGFNLNAVRKRVELAKERSRQQEEMLLDKPEDKDADGVGIQPSDEDPTASSEEEVPITTPPAPPSVDIPPETMTSVEVMPQETTVQPIPTPEAQEEIPQESVQQQPPPIVEEPPRPDSDDEDFSVATPSEQFEPLSDHSDEYGNAVKSPELPTPPSSVFEETPPTEEPVAPDYEAPPPPPTPGQQRPVYNCRAEYIPLPGSDSGWLAVVEKFRAQSRDWVLDYLPAEWSEWICTNVSITYLPFVPVCHIMFTLSVLIPCQE